MMTVFAMGSGRQSCSDICFREIEPTEKTRMADGNLQSRASGDIDEKMPRWVKLIVIAAVVFVLAFVLLRLCMGLHGH